MSLQNIHCPNGVVVNSDLPSTEVPICPQCSQLHQALNSARMCYQVALRSEFFKVCTLLAARKQVDMERARLAYVEHRSICERRKRNRAAEITTPLIDDYPHDRLIPVSYPSALQPAQVS